MKYQAACNRIAGFTHVASCLRQMVKLLDFDNFTDNFVNVGQRH